MGIIIQYETEYCPWCGEVITGRRVDEVELPAEGGWRRIEPGPKRYEPCGHRVLVPQ